MGSPRHRLCPALAQDPLTTEHLKLSLSQSKLRAAAHAGQVQKWLHLQTLSAAPAPPAAALSRLLLQKGVHVEAARMPQHERAR
eukprot:scaffold318828_cov15-Tisochrysis_lutea.AAC.1